MISKLSTLKNFYIKFFVLFFISSSFGQNHQSIMESIRTSIRINSVKTGATSTNPCLVSSSTNISLDSAVAADLATIQSNGRWNDINYADTDEANTWEPFTHITRLQQFADAYSSIQSNYYNNSTLYNALVNGLDYYYQVNPDCTNWWWVKIKAPRHLCLILILARAGVNQIPSSLEENILVRLDSITPTPGQYTGANKLDIDLWHFYQGLLLDSSTKVSTAVNQAYSVLALTTDEGIQHDYSYNQHGSQLYITGYGEVLLNGINSIAKHLTGSSYALSGTYLDNYKNFTLGSFAQSRRGKYAGFNTPGRQISNPNKLIGGSGVFKDAKLVNPMDSLAYQYIIDRLVGTTSPNSNINEKNSYYYRSLYTTHNRSAFNFTILANNKRTKKTETGNNENIKGRFLAEGSTNILVNGNEYYNIFPVWDWNKIPGVTVPEYTGNNLRPPSDWGISGTSDFAGGVSDGTYGIQVFEMDEYNTQIKKGWFLFDDEIVCLGANLNSTALEKINTTLNQCHLDGPVTISENSTISTLSSVGEFNYIESVDWVLHDSIGYFFPNGGNLKLSNQSQTGSWENINTKGCGNTITKDVFKLWFDHGTSPVNNSYAYIIAPNKKSVTEMQAYNLNNIKILENNNEVQAVKNESLDMIQIIFYKPKTVILDGNITIGVDKPCALILNNVSTSHVTVHISDPSELISHINVVWESSSISPLRKLETIMPTGTAYLGSTVEYEINLNTQVGSLIAYDYTETFENMTHSNWGTETYTGDNGFTWSVNAKGVSGYIDATKGIYFHHSTTGVQSGTISGGIGSFSVTCKDLWSSGSDRTIELLINGNVVNTFIHNGTEVYTYTVNNINIAGDFTLAIRNASSTSADNTLAIDNISWTGYGSNSKVSNKKALVLEETINKFSSSSTKVYPNPVLSQLNLVSEIYGHFSVDIFDLLGKHIKHIALVNSNNSTNSIDVSNFQAGIYLLMINSTNNELSEVLKFVKK